ncbi:hypothetical protein [Methylobacterium aquaticum]|uniref:Uncharacterized protein n=1 Tax=Methylobacterium aquaticum TaxID=270351 RepID=A0A1Y0ZGI0_9HYPH|nr:hypothetical protein [Methylobacterium aquaticum]BAR47336.1 hypothetical protein Maq22A_1p38540 [Methylobacterium aquaticum]
MNATVARSQIVVPPAFCDLEWCPGGRVYDPRSAYRWTAAKTPVYERAVRAAHRAMTELGFDLTRTRVTLDLPMDIDPAFLAKRLGTWDRVAREAYAREMASDARRAALPTAVTAPTQEALKALLRDHEWAFRRLDEAHRFATSDWLTAAQHQFARDILSDAQTVVRKVEERLATPAGEADLARAQDPDVRRDVHAACRILTELDQDRARDANGSGWGQDTSLVGHRLAEEQALTVLQAAHALKVVHKHRRQLPLALRERLFGWEPSFRRTLPPPRAKA